MARIETDPNYTTPTFSRATAATDPFKKEDVQGVAAALSVHDHTGGKGLLIPALALAGGITQNLIADGAINSAKVQDKSLQAIDLADGIIQLGSTLIADGAINNAKLQDKTVNYSKIADGGLVTSLYQDGSVTTAKLGGNAATYLGYYQANAGNTTTSTSPVLIAGTTFTFTATFGAHVLVHGSSPIYSNKINAQMFLYLFIDGSQYATVAFANCKAAGITDQMHFTYVIPGTTLSAASHTLGMGWSTEAASTLTQNAAGSTTFCAVELRR